MIQSTIEHKKEGMQCNACGKYHEVMVEMVHGMNPCQPIVTLICEDCAKQLRDFLNCSLAVIERAK